MNEIKVGVLSIQGDVAENVLATQQALSELGESGSVTLVKSPEQFSNLDGLIIPGGESTMIGQLSLVNGALKTIKEKIQSGIPVLGTCAGLIILSKNTKDRIIGKTDQPLLDLLDVQVERNSFGRQKDSFESEISMSEIGIPRLNGVFIRAPSISEVGKNVQIISKFNEKIIAVKQGNILATAFHPELSNDVSLHKYFIKMIKESKNN